jgi:hypothetical protein
MSVVPLEAAHLFDPNATILGWLHLRHNIAFMKKNCFDHISNFYKLLKQTGMKWLKNRNT